MKYIIFLILCFLGYESVLGQHCAPIEESYLTTVSLSHQEENLKFHLEYFKSGGKVKQAYQIYLIAYLEKNESAVFEEQKEKGKINAQLKNIKNDSVVMILDTEVIRLSENKVYIYDYTVSMNKLVETIVKKSKLDKKDRHSNGGYGYFNDKIKIAVLIPFLESTELSNDKRLPSDKHECNYAGKSSLLFQPLPYEFEIQFGTKLGKSLNDDFYININQSH